MRQLALTKIARIFSSSLARLR